MGVLYFLLEENVLRAQLHAELLALSTGQQKAKGEVSEKRARAGHFVYLLSPLTLLKDKRVLGKRSSLIAALGQRSLSFPCCI